MSDEPAVTQAPASEGCPPALLPLHVVVLALTAALAVFVAWNGAAAWHEAAAAGTVPPETRRVAIFLYLFNLAVAPALVVAWLGEAVAAAVFIARGVQRRRVATRLLIALVPLAVLVIGHQVINPWFVDLVMKVAAAARG